jgi:hypothetical protein
MNRLSNYKNYLTTTLFSAFALSIGLGVGMFFSSAAQDSGTVFELRMYTATEGKLDNLHVRFRDHTTRLFRKHGIEVVGYWTLTSEEERDLVYILEHQSQAAANASWRAFDQDPEWQEVLAASNANGSIVSSSERHYMVATDYSPLR